MTAAGRPQSVVLIRHGATDWSEAGRHTGWTDIPLNAEGRRQAATLVRPLMRWTFDTVLCSPLRRAAATCELAGLSEQPRTDPDLREWNYGDYEGLTAAQIRERVPGWTLWDNGVVGGETIAEVGERADRVITRLRWLPGTVAIVAHGHLLRVLASRWIDQAPGLARCLSLSTAAISELGWEHDWRAITLWNDAGHLGTLDQRAAPPSTSSEDAAAWLRPGTAGRSPSRRRQVTPARPARRDPRLP